jgi:hypothetical protein
MESYRKSLQKGDQLRTQTRGCAAHRASDLSAIHGSVDICHQALNPKFNDADPLWRRRHHAYFSGWSVLGLVVSLSHQ